MGEKGPGNGGKGPHCQVSPTRFAGGQGTTRVTQVGRNTLRVSGGGGDATGFACRVVGARVRGGAHRPP